MFILLSVVYQAAKQGLSSRGGLVCWLTVRPVPWMLHFVTKRHQKRYSRCSGCSMWVISGLCQTISCYRRVFSRLRVAG